LQKSPLESSCVVVALIATSRKVAGSIPDCVIGISLWHNPSDHTMTPGSTQPLTEMSTTDICRGGQGVETAGEQGWQHYDLHVSIVFLNSGNLNVLEPSDPVQAHYKYTFTFIISLICDNTVTTVSQVKMCDFSGQTLKDSVEITNKMQPCIRIYYSTVHWSINVFRAAYRSSSGALNCICSLWFT
jgi:hypothetical protein